MESTGIQTNINDEIQHISLHNSRKIIFHGYIFPFVFLHIAWLYVWTAEFDYNDTQFELGMIGFAIVGLLQILTTLFCLWFVQVKVLLTCSSVC